MTSNQGTEEEMPEEEAVEDESAPDRGPGWEYLLFIAEMEYGLSRLATAIADFRSGYAREISTEPLDKPQAIKRISTEADRVKAMVENLGRLLSRDVQERAFGRPGEPGDEAAIRHLARRMTDVFTEMLTWAGALRGALVDETLRPVFWALSNFVRRPVELYETFVGELDEKLGRPIQERRAGRASDPVSITLMLEIAIDPADQAAFHDALGAL